MPEGKRPDPRRRSSSAKKAPASRPGGRATPRAIAARRESRAADSPTASEDAEFVDLAEGEAAGGSIRQSIVASAEAAAEQRFGSAARRAAILAAVICVLTLTIAGPVRTYFAQRTEMKQLQVAEAQLREQISELEEQRAKLADPVFIAAQARERLGFVMPGEIPYQVQLPAGAAQPSAPTADPTEAASTDPWYTALWQTISEEPHGIAPTTAPPPVPGGAPVPPPVAPTPGG